jgi:hypothetical protein
MSDGVRLFFFIRCLWLFVIGGWASLAAGDVNSYHIWRELGQTSDEEDAVSVIGSRIVILDDGLIEDDKVFLRGTNPTQKSDWLLRNGQGFISLAQTRQTRWNETIECDHRSRILGRRPSDYGRALVYRSFEVKGSGGSLSVLDNKDGLLSLRMALREYLFEKIEYIYLRRLLPHIPDPLVGIYAVADLGFHMNKESLPAGNLSRPLHRRMAVSDPRFLPRVLEIEEALRYVGITSAVERYTFEVSVPNIQLSEDGRLIDLGSHQVFESTFPRLRVGEVQVDVQAIAHLAAPFELLGRTYLGAGPGERYRDRALELANRWANGFVDGTLTSRKINAEVRVILDDIRRRAELLPTLAELKKHGNHALVLAANRAKSSHLSDGDSEMPKPPGPDALPFADSGMSSPRCSSTLSGDSPRKSRR